MGQPVLPAGNAVAQTISTLTKLKTIWKDKNIALSSNQTDAILGHLNFPVRL